MKNTEFYRPKEYYRPEEMKSFKALEYYKAPDNKTDKENLLLDEDNKLKESRKKAYKGSSNSFKDTITKASLSPGLMATAGTVVVTGTTAVGVVAANNNKPEPLPKVIFNDVLVGDDFFTYELELDKMDENYQYELLVNDFKYPVESLKSSNLVNNLKPNSNYQIKLLKNGQESKVIYEDSIKTTDTHETKVVFKVNNYELNNLTYLDYEIFVSDYYKNYQNYSLNINCYDDLYYLDEEFLLNYFRKEKMELPRTNLTFEVIGDEKTLIDSYLFNNESKVKKPEKFVGSYDKPLINELTYDLNYHNYEVKIPLNFKNESNYDFNYKITAYENDLEVAHAYGQELNPILYVSEDVKKINLKLEIILYLDEEEFVYETYQFEGVLNLLPPISLEKLEISDFKLINNGFNYEVYLDAKIKKLQDKDYTLKVIYTDDTNKTYEGKILNQNKLSLMIDNLMLNYLNAKVQILINEEVISEEVLESPLKVETVEVSVPSYNETLLVNDLSYETFPDVKAYGIFIPIYYEEGSLAKKWSLEINAKTSSKELNSYKVEGSKNVISIDPSYPEFGYLINYLDDEYLYDVYFTFSLNYLKMDGTYETYQKITLKDPFRLERMGFIAPTLTSSDLSVERLNQDELEVTYLPVFTHQVEGFSMQVKLTPYKMVDGNYEMGSQISMLNMNQANNKFKITLPSDTTGYTLIIDFGYNDKYLMERYYLREIRKIEIKNVM